MFQFGANKATCVCRNQFYHVFTDHVEVGDCIWATSWQNQWNGMCFQGTLRSAWASTSLIRVFTVRMMTTWVLSYPLSAQRRLWSDWADAQADLRHRWVHMRFRWFCHEAAHMLLKLNSNIGSLQLKDQQKDLQKDIIQTKLPSSRRRYVYCTWQTGNVDLLWLRRWVGRGGGAGTIHIKGLQVDWHGFENWT